MFQSLELHQMRLIERKIERRFQQMIDKAGVTYNLMNATARSADEAVEILAKKIGYPLVVRPSYVSGWACYGNCL